MKTKQSWLDDTFYEHFFHPDEKARSEAAKQLDEEFDRLATSGVGRYEIIRQMLCGVWNAQQRRDNEPVDQSYHVDDEEKAPGPRTAPTTNTRNILPQLMPVALLSLVLALCIITLVKIF